MLVTLKEILNYAEANKCAIGAFHILSEDNLTAVLDAAQELRFPVIIMHSQENEKKLPLANIGPLMVDMAEKASVPVCVHLDHGMTINYIRQALIIGFSSVTYDGSSLPYEENIPRRSCTWHPAVLPPSKVLPLPASLNRMSQKPCVALSTPQASAHWHVPTAHYNT